MGGHTEAVRSQVAALLPPRLRDGLGWRDTTPRELVPSGSSALDALIGGLPRGAITEIVGETGSGRTSFLHTALSVLTGAGESVAYLDASDSFGPAAAASSGVLLSHVLWLRCGKRVEKLWSAADLLLQSGGFGVVVLDLGDVSGANVRHLPPSTWYRFRNVVEKTPTVLLVVSSASTTQSCAALRLHLERTEVRWSGRLPDYPVLYQLGYSVAVDRPTQDVTIAGRVRAGD